LPNVPTARPVTGFAGKIAVRHRDTAQNGAYERCTETSQNDAHDICPTAGKTEQEMNRTETQPPVKLPRRPGPSSYRIDRLPTPAGSRSCQRSDTALPASHTAHCRVRCYLVTFHAVRDHTPPWLLISG
jgi:hypothetical protein